MSEIRIFNAALEHDEFSRDVVRGTIDQECLRMFKNDWYQRKEGFSEREITELAEKYFRHEKVPDTIIGMRGHRIRQEQGVFWLNDACYVIDGVQRLLAAKVALTSRPSLKLRIGAKIFLDTTSEIENEMFCEINATQQRVSASVLLRNKYKTSPSVKLLYTLGNADEFALKDRIGWDQKLSAGQSVSGFALCCIAGALHMHKKGMSAGRAYDVMDSLDKVVAQIGGQVFYDNVMKFYDLLDSCWTIRNDKQPKCLDRDIMTVLANLLSSYYEFWDAEELYIADKYQKRLASLDMGSMKQQYRQMTKNNRNVKDCMFQIFRQRLKLDPTGSRRPPPKDDDSDEARFSASA